VGEVLTGNGKRLGRKGGEVLFDRICRDMGSPAD
jgi:hypothetical protein